MIMTEDEISISEKFYNSDKGVVILILKRIIAKQRFFYLFITKTSQFYRNRIALLLRTGFSNWLLRSIKASIKRLAQTVQYLAII